MIETVNLGVLFRKARKGQLTEKQKNPQRSSKNKYKRKIKVSGIRSVAKVKSISYEQGYYFKYTYKDGERTRSIQAKTMKQLYDRMKEKNFHFIVYDVKKARNFLDKNCNDEDYRFFLYNVLQK